MISLIAHTIQVGTGTGATTSAINTTGANLIVLAIGNFISSSGVGVSDSKSNTWTGLTASSGGGGGGLVRFYYCLGPTVGTGHTFTVSGSNCFSPIGVMAFSGILTASALDVQSTGIASAASVQPGSITPSQAGELIASACVFDAGGTLSVDSSITLTDQVNYSSGSSWGLAMGYLVQTSAAAINPTWSVSGTHNLEAAIASFKAASAPSSGLLTRRRLAAARAA